MKLAVMLTFTSKHFIRNAQYTSVINPCHSRCSGLSQILPKSCSPLFGDELLYNFCSLHIRQCNIFPASCLLFASHSHICVYLICESLACCLRVTHVSILSSSRVACEWLMISSRIAHKSLTCNLWVLVTLWLSCTAINSYCNSLWNLQCMVQLNYNF